METTQHLKDNLIAKLTTFCMAPYHVPVHQSKTQGAGTKHHKYFIGHACINKVGGVIFNYYTPPCTAAQLYLSQASCQVSSSQSGQFVVMLAINFKSELTNANYEKQF